MSQPIVERKKLIISRSTWARGVRNKHDIGSIKENLLLGYDGMMCCLGFAAINLCGASKKDILGVGLPHEPEVKELFNRGMSWLFSKTSITNGFINSSGSSADLERLIAINDSTTYSESEREEKIIEVFAGNGVDVEFTE